MKRRLEIRPISGIIALETNLGTVLVAWISTIA